MFVKNTKKILEWSKLKYSLVQILVTVAIIQTKNLKIVAEKGFRRTLFELELVDPNSEINFEKRFSVLTGYLCKNIYLEEAISWIIMRKGK